MHTRARTDRQMNKERRTFMIRSQAPIRVKMRSTSVRLQDEAENWKERERFGKFAEQKVRGDSAEVRHKGKTDIFPEKPGTWQPRCAINTMTPV